VTSPVSDRVHGQSLHHGSLKCGGVIYGGCGKEVDTREACCWSHVRVGVNPGNMHTVNPNTTGRDVKFGSKTGNRT
jgi:hypothetical protein